jgi:Rieske Fe-S protein
VIIDPASVAPGEVKTVQWRGQPVWVMRRTPEMLASLEGITDLADPASEKQQPPDCATNTHRSIKPSPRRSVLWMRAPRAPATPWTDAVAMVQPHTSSRFQPPHPPLSTPK